MKTHFKDRCAIPPGKKINSPFDFNMPPYDQRSSCAIKAGTDYGVGPRQPVGHDGNPKKEGVPFGRHPTMKVDHVHSGRTKDVEFNEYEK